MRASSVSPRPSRLRDDFRGFSGVSLIEGRFVQEDGKVGGIERRELVGVLTMSSISKLSDDSIVWKRKATEIVSQSGRPWRNRRRRPSLLLSRILGSPLR
jgi:hypothetical protein